MDNNDIVQIQDVAAVRTSVLQNRRKVLAVALATPVLATLLAFPFIYYFTALGAVASLVLATVFFCLAFPFSFIGCVTIRAFFGS